MFYNLRFNYFLVFFCFYGMKAQNVITVDIDNFWNAYGKIITTKDSALQRKYLHDFYFTKGTDGLKAIRKARNYTDQEYIDAINNYPAFWTSIKSNTLKAKKYSKELEIGISKLRNIYPELKPAKIYFTIGALRTNGTFSDNSVLIGSEIAMTDKNTITKEFPESIRKGRREYFDSNPINNLVLLNIHEYVHTQQKSIANNLLSYVISEGVAEFISVKALGIPSTTPSINFGNKNSEVVRSKFEEQMFYINNQHYWLWSDAKNDFGVRDLGYYIGYQICENIYNNASDKKAIIKKMIELDYSNETDMEIFINSSNFFSKPVKELYTDFENNRPFVTGIKEFKNGSSKVSSKISEITIQFSSPLNGFNTGIDYGNLGDNAFPKNNAKNRYWSDDKKSWSIPVTLEPNKKYQMIITSNFRTEKNIPLKEFLIEFQTGE